MCRGVKELGGLRINVPLQGGTRTWRSWRGRSGRGCSCRASTTSSCDYESVLGIGALRDTLFSSEDILSRLMGAVGGARQHRISGAVLAAVLFLLGRNTLMAGGRGVLPAASALELWLGVLTMPRWRRHTKPANAAVAGSRAPPASRRSRIDAGHYLTSCLMKSAAPER